MRRKQRRKALWMASVAALTIAAIVIPILVFADSEPVVFTATLYSDVIRFEANGVANLRVTIYDLSENELWSSGLIMGDFVDWDRTNERGERLANGYYLYLAQGWDASDHPVLNKTGKVVLLPGDQVELKTAPAMGTSSESTHDDRVYAPMTQTINDSLRVEGDLTVTMVGHFGELGTSAGQARFNGDTSMPTSDPGFGFYSDGSIQYFFYMDMSQDRDFRLYDYSNAVSILRLDRSTGDLEFNPAGNVGIGTTTPAAKLHVNGNTAVGGSMGVGTISITDKLTIQAGSGNLIACYPDGDRNPGDAVFRVESDGDVYADGTVYSFDTEMGGADVAERINASEWVEAGDVVEIDPDHVGFFRKATGAYSRRVAGIISTSPGVILGNDVDPTSDEWNDNRPVLAIAGRVPVKASAENGPIAVGDLLVSSSVPGVAMKGDPAVSIGAVVAKAMEPLDGGEGVIMAQVTLR